MRSFRERSPVLVGIISLIVLIAAVAFAFSINRFEALRGVYTIYADVEDVAGLRAGNEVRVAGVKVGQVKGVGLERDAARVRMEVQNRVQIPRETILEVKLKTLLGQKFVDLQVPQGFRAAGGAADDLMAAAGGFFEAGDVIPLDQTRVPYDIYQAATEGTRTLEEIDKEALRDMIEVLATTFEASKYELGRALAGVSEAGEVLGGKSDEIRRFLRNAEHLTGTLAGSDQDIEGILTRSSEVLGTLAEHRAALSSLLEATNNIGTDLGTLIQAVRGNVEAGFSDLSTILASVQGEMDSLDAALVELGDAQRMFAQPGGFGRFVEAHACAVTSADTCVPRGSPEDPGVPVHGVQPGARLGARLLP